MKISARNILAGTVSSVKKGKVVAIVKVKLNSGNEISSIITNDSVNRLELKKGKAAYAIVKASSVMIGTGKGDLMISARNIVSGKIKKIKEGMVMAEIVLDLGNGETISATISDESTKKLGLKKSGNAIAIFKATSVMIGID